MWVRVCVCVGGECGCVRAWVRACQRPNMRVRVHMQRFGCIYYVCKGDPIRLAGG